MRISDWSSDVCSSDLEYEGHEVGRNGSRAEEYGAGHKRAGACYPQIGGPDLPRFVMHLRECGKGCGLQRLYDHAAHHVESTRSTTILRTCGRAKEGADEQGCELRVCLTQPLPAKVLCGAAGAPEARRGGEKW